MTTATKTGIRCPHCGRKVAEKLVGKMWLRCIKCKADLYFNFDKGMGKKLN